MAEGKSRGKEGRPELSRLELSIMDVVWQLGECSSAEVIEAFRERRDLAPTTVRTVLANLRKKGYLEPVPTIERGFRIKPTVTRGVVAKRSLRELLQNLFEGSPRQAIAHLLKSERLSDADLEEIRRLIDNRKSREKNR
jgi:BlaI family transcriptional regulator, penicillinase repressor